MFRIKLYQWPSDLITVIGPFATWTAADAALADWMSLGRHSGGCIEHKEPGGRDWFLADEA